MTKLDTLEINALDRVLSTLEEFSFTHLREQDKTFNDFIVSVYHDVERQAEKIIKR